MSTIKKTVSVNKIKQLIDLNGDKINYELNFSVKSKDDLPFEMIVVSQSTLDSGEKIDYKNITNGFISGNIVADKNVYQNYFLLLKSENPTECYIEISIKDIPVNKEFLRQQEIQNNNLLKEQNNKLLQEKTDDSKKSNYKIIVFIVVIIIIGILLYYFFYNKDSTTSGTTSNEIDIATYSNSEDMSSILPTTPSVIESFDTNNSIENNVLSSNYPEISNPVELNIEPVEISPPTPINPLLAKINNMKFY